jgi:hypothetical protein
MTLLEQARRILTADVEPAMLALYDQMSAAIRHELGYDAGDAAEVLEAFDRCETLDDATLVADALYVSALLLVGV